MKIAIIGATGKSGRLIMEEARNRGHEVTAIVRDEKKLNQNDIAVIEKDLFSLTTDDLADFDAVVDAFGVWRSDQSLHISSLNHLAQILANQSPWLYVVGGAGSLYVDDTMTLQLMNSDGFPEAYYPTASNMGLALDALRQRDDVNWVYVSTAANFDFEAPKTGTYTLSGEVLTLNSKGESMISYADYAIAMIDIIEERNNLHKRISVVSE